MKLRVWRHLWAALLLPTLVFANDDAPQNWKTVPHKLVLNEVGGGSDSSVSPDGKFIAFSSRRNGNLDIYTVEVETGKVRQITSNPATDNEPRWHPDSADLVFVTMRDGSQDVYRINLETLEETPIATEPFNEDYPSFSKDGTMACFTGGPRGYREVQVHNFATGETRTLTRGFGYVGSTNFSPDGKHVVFHAYYDNSYASGKADVYIVPVAGGKPVNVTKDRDVWDYKPNWSFDGDWITFSSKRGTPNFNIWVMRTDGKDLHPVTAIDGPVPMRGGRVSMANANVLDQRWSNWTKDGRIGWHQINSQQGRLLAVDAESGSITKLYESEFAINELDTSPDHSKVLFETNAEVFVMDARVGAVPKQVGEGIKPSWARDGKSITFWRRWGRQAIRVDLDGNELAVFEARRPQWEHLSYPWSPDGKRLAYNSDLEGKRNLVVVNEDGDEKVLVADGKVTTNPVWSQDGKFVFYGENIPPSVSYYISTVAVNDSGEAHSGG